MTYIPCWFIRSLVAYSIILSVHSKEYDALIFYSNNLDICNLNEKDQTCAVACPAQLEDKNIRNFLKNIRYRDMPLFIEQIDITQELQKNQRGKCELGFAMSALHIPDEESEDEFVELGFLIFYEKSKFEGKVTQLKDFDQVTAVSDVDSIRKRTGTWVRHSLNHFLRTQPRLEEKWGFTRISKIDLNYNFSSRTLIWLEYKVRPIQIDQVELKCNDYELFTNEYNTNEHMEKLYAKDNQGAIFKKFAILRQSCTECVKKYNLVLPYQFQASSADEISCSNMTTIPLWYGIPELEQTMDHIEKFLIAVAQALGEGNRLVVRTGVLGQLTLPLVSNGKQMEVYLDADKKKVPVPNVIYKFVRYRNHKYDPRVHVSLYFHIVIVIHNYPVFTPQEKLCKDDECESLGWDGIQYPDSDKSDKEKKSKFVYCCKLSEGIAESIRFPWNENESKPFNLKSLKYSRYPLNDDAIPLLEKVESDYKELLVRDWWRKMQEIYNDIKSLSST